MVFQTGYFENDMPGSYASVFTIKCRYQCLDGEGGTGIGVATLPLSLLRIISCAFFLKELFVRANRKCIFTGNYVTRGKIDSFK